MRDKVLQLIAAAQGYIDSDKFEKDLDRFAREIKIDFENYMGNESYAEQHSPDRTVRLRAKGKAIAKKCGTEVMGENPLTFMAGALLPRKGLLRRARLVLGSAYGAYLLFVAIRVLLTKDHRQ